MELKEKMDRMVEELNAANYRYYVLDDPTMDDRDYDLKLRELEELEKDHPELARADSPTKRVGGEALPKFEKVTHPVPLNSLQDVFCGPRYGIFRGAEDRWPFRGTGI